MEENIVLRQLKNGAEAAIIGSAAKEKIGSIDRERILVIEDNLDYIFGQIVAEFWNRPSRNLNLLVLQVLMEKLQLLFYWNIF